MIKNFSKVQFSVFLIFFTAFLTLACTEDPIEKGIPGTITGKITIADGTIAELNDASTLFIVARKSAGPPLAVKKVPNPKFPFFYQLSESDAMIPGTIFQGEVQITARLDQDGIVGPPEPGDLNGIFRERVPIGATDVDIELTKGQF